MRRQCFMLLAAMLINGFWLGLNGPQPAYAAQVRFAMPDGLASGACDSWETACMLTYAIQVAASGDEIWVAAGTYTPTTGTDRKIGFSLKNEVAIYGGFGGSESSREGRDWVNNVTILSGDIGAVGVNTDNSYNVFYNNGVTSSAVLDGFSISGGYANLDAKPPYNAGGGMFNSGSSPTLTNLIFTGNTALWGGAMCNSSSSSPTLTNITFSGNAVGMPGYGGYGGAMFNESSSSPVMDKVTFSANTAVDDGGGLYNFMSSVQLTDVTFSGNTARDGGGMINDNSSAALTHVTFINNHASGRGGGLFNSDASATLSGVTFSGNNAHADGGGMADENSSSSTTLTEVTFSGNTAGAWGGGMFIFQSRLVMDHAIFSGNTAGILGGGLYNSYYSNPTLTDIAFTGNQAGLGKNNPGDGGGIANLNNSSPTLTGVTISRNTARYGGGIYNDSSSPILTNVIISSNTADTGGGGMDNRSSSPVLTNVVFSGNVVSYYGGGGMENGGGSPVLTNVTFYGNNGGQFGGAMLNYDNCNPKVRNSILWGNTAANAAQVDNRSSAPVYTKTIIQGETSGGEVLAIDPLFVDADGADDIPGTEDDNLRLRAASPAINRGDSAVTNPGLPAADLDQLPRIVDGAVDLGAYENQSPNHAPVLTGPVSDLALLEDPTSNPGVTISSLISGHVTDPDGNAAGAGIAVFAAGAASGQWEYSLDGATWTALGGVSDASAVLLGPDTLLRFVPAADWNGAATLDFRAWDGADLRASGATGVDIRSNGWSTAFSADTATLAAVVAAVNDAPRFSFAGDLAVNEDAGAMTVSNWASNISAGPADEAGQTLAFLLTTSNDALFSALPAIDAATGALTFTPAADASGAATVTVSLRDDGGTANGGKDTSDLWTFLITINAVNDAPSFVKGSDQMVNEDAGEQWVYGWATNITPGPMGESDQTLTFILTTDNDALFRSQPFVNPWGDLTYKPAANASGTATVTVILRDSGGTASGGSNTSGPQTFTITVNAVNDAPVLDPIPDQAVNEGDILSFTLAGTDLYDTPPNDLVYSVTGLPEGADYQLNALTGAFRWATGQEEGPAQYTLTFTVTDNGLPALSAAQTVSVTILALNDLHLAVSVLPNPVLAGGVLFYTITITNPNPDAASGLTITAQLADGLTFGMAFPDFNCQSVERQVTCTPPDIPAQGSFFLMFIAAVDKNIPHGTLLPFSASLTAAQPDPDLSSNTVAITTLVLTDYRIYLPLAVR